jgi:hypothetical protein
MALPSSGVLTLNDIQTEFGGTNPIDLSDYYRGGGLVPDSALNAAIPTSGVISVSDFYGAANVIPINYAQTFAGTINNGASINIGTARSTRWVIIQGIGGGVRATSGSIGGVTAAFISGIQGTSATCWMGWAKVPTGTTATVVLNVSSAPNCRVSTFNSVNSNYSAIFNTTVNFSSNSSAPVSTTNSFTVTDPGIVFSSIAAASPTGSTSTLTSTSPGSVTYNFPSVSNTGAMGYNITSTNDSRTWTYSASTNSGFKNQPALAVMSVFFSAN